MPIYRGPGGSGDATNDATITAVAEYAAQAATSATNAANSATTSGTSATNSANSANSASASASAAATSASQAATSQSAAATSATTAASSATTAGTQATVATTQANNAANSASSAAASAATATTKASEAATSASNAATSATNSANSAASALAIYGNTTAMNNAVTAATTSASNAATSASQAAASSGTASDYATQAATSASSASNSASDAATSASTASSAAAGAEALYGDLGAVNAAVTASANSATNAGISAGQASTSATNAANSATASANSATQSANSAASAAAIVTGVASNRPSIRPSLLLDFANTKQLDPRITYTRASTGTYYDGKTVVKAEENLLVQSQDFASTWEKAADLTLTTNTTTAPNGTTTASTFAETAVTSISGFRIQQTPVVAANTRYTFSAFVKDVDVRYIALVFFGVTSNYAWAEFDLSSTGSVSRSGALGTGWTLNSSSITATANGYFRVLIDVTTGTTITTPRVRLGLSDGVATITTAGNFSYTGTSKSAYFWGAQLEQRSTATSYTPTTTAPITNYIPALQTAVSNEARFDHDPVTWESKGLLIEEQRSNLVTYSDDFSNAAWTKTRTSIETNVIVAPDGTLTGDKLVEDTSASTSHLLRATSQAYTSGTTYTFSFFLKAAERSIAYFQFRSAAFTSSYGVKFNLSTGTIISNEAAWITASISAAGNGWWRITATAAATITYTGNDGFYLYTADSSGTTVYTGNGYSGLYIWGAQLEAGAFPTSYIPTVASQVTRSADAASMTGSNFSSWYRADEGTLYGEADWMGLSNNDYFFAINNGTASNTIGLGVSTSPVIRFIVVDNTVTQASISGGTPTANTFFKIAGAYKLNDFIAATNSILGTADTSGTIPTGMSEVSFNSSYGTTSNLFNGHIKRIAYYPKRLSNTELQGITS